MISKIGLLIVIVSVAANTSCNRKKENCKQKNNGNTSLHTQDRKLIKKTPVVIPVSSLSVKIGLQEWTTKNLDVVTFQNGDTIPEAQTDKEWEAAGDEGRPAWCYYLNNSALGMQYGKLYNFFAVDDPRGLAPHGWHIPTDEEWIRMTKVLKDNYGDKLKSESGWFNGGNGTNQTGFSALPGGIRYYDGEFMDFGNYGFWWTSSSVVLTHAWLRYLTDDYGDKIFRTKARRAAGLSVRCIKDYETN